MKIEFVQSDFILDSGNYYTPLFKMSRDSLTIDTTIDNTFDVKLGWGSSGQSATISNAILILY